MAAGVNLTAGLPPAAALAPSAAAAAAGGAAPNLRPVAASVSTCRSVLEAQQLREITAVELELRQFRQMQAL